MTRYGAAVTSLLLLAAAGCGRAHLDPAHGVAYRQAFAAQVVPGPPPSRPPVMALDPQEADVISQAYLRSLAGKSRAEAPEPVVYVSPPSRAMPPALAPSVPRN